MSKTPVRHLRIMPTRDSRLLFDDSKELISYLSEICQKQPFELIIRSSSGSGIELLMSANLETAESIKRYIYSIRPDIVLDEVNGSAMSIKQPTYALEYKFAHHYALPLASNPSSSDELSRLMHCLAQIDARETVDLKLSAHKVRPLKARLLRRRLLEGESPALVDPSVSGSLFRLLLLAARSLVMALRAALYIIQNLSYEVTQQNLKGSKHQGVINSRSVMILDKLYEPLFKTKLSLRVKAASPKKAEALAKDLTVTLNSFASSSGYQQFKSVKRRNSADIYSASDLAALYHIDEAGHAGGIYRQQRFKSLPASRELRRQKLPGDVLLGFNNYQGANNGLTLSSSARQRHLYISGATGSGKSTLLASLVLQDIESGQGLSLIDPHGDLALDVMKRLPKDRLKDVVYFDPSSPKSRLSINLLEINAKPGTQEYIQETDQVTESLISLFRKVFSSEDNGGHRVEYILRNSIHTAIDIPNSTIFTIFRLLTDSAFRLRVIPTIKDQDLANFWRNELGRAGEYQRVKMSAGVTSKIGRFLFSEPAKRVFGQSSSSLDIAKLMNDNQILICNFAKGQLGEDGSRLFSAAILTKLQLSALARVKNSPLDRSPHYLYVDEFQNHAPSSIVQMLSEARKYGLYLIMAEQSPYQQDAQTTKSILANVGNLLCFRTALPKDEGLLMPNFEGSLSSNDLNNLPAYKFYFKSTAEEVIPPTSGQTFPIPQPVLAVRNLGQDQPRRLFRQNLVKARQAI